MLVTARRKRVPSESSDHSRELLDLGRHRGRDARLAEARHALEAAVGVERHDARQDRHVDAVGAAVLDEGHEDVEVVCEAAVLARGGAAEGERRAEREKQ